MKLYFLESEVSGGHGEQNIYGVEEDNWIRKSYPESLGITMVIRVKKIKIREKRKYKIIESYHQKVAEDVLESLLDHLQQ